MTRARAAEPRAPGARAPQRWRGERGSVTIEFALALPTAVMMLGAVLAMVAWAHTSLRVQDAASVAVRVAVTDSDEAALHAGREVAGGHAHLQLSRADGWITVHANVPARGWLPGSSARATAPEQP